MADSKNGVKKQHIKWRERLSRVFVIHFRFIFHCLIQTKCKLSSLVAVIMFPSGIMIIVIIIIIDMIDCLVIFSFPPLNV